MDVPVPMLAVAGPLPTGPGWGFELKWDGQRIVALVEDGGVRLYSRNHKDYTTSYPELGGLAQALGRDAVLDGEAIVLGDGARPSWPLISRRMQTRNAARARQLARELPAVYMVFDVLVWAGEDQRARPYSQRRKLLESLPLAGRWWSVPPSLDDGPAAQQAARDVGAEGVVAKRLASVYLPGRSRDWIKVKDQPTLDVTVVGYQITDTGRLSLLLTDGAQYRGRVTASAAEQEVLLELLRDRVTDEPALDIPAAATWVRPGIVVEVGYREIGETGRLRHPVYIRYRPDKTEL